MSQIFTSRAKFNKVLSLIDQGQLTLAEGQCRQAIKDNSKDVNMLALLGAILLKGHKRDEAEEFLLSAIDKAPTFAKPHEDLGQLYFQRGDLHTAARYLKKAIRLDPQLENAHFTLGKALIMQGKGKEGDEAIEKSFALNPERRMLAVAAEHHKEGRVEDAERAYRRVLKDNPKNVTAMRLLATIAVETMHHDEAIRLLLQATELAPDFVGAIVDLGLAYQEQSQLLDAIEWFDRAVSLEPNSAQIHYLLATALAPAAQTNKAVQSYKRAVELRPNHAAAWLGLGHVLKTVGEQEQAIKAYRQCLEVKPDNGEAYWSLANLKTYKLSDDDISTLETAVETEVEPQSKVNMLFSLAKAYEDREHFDTAWRYYTLGNNTQRVRERYDPVETEVTNKAILDVFRSDFLSQAKDQGNPDPAPIFIVGLPRSGSTLIEQILASHSLVEGTSELPYLARVATSLNRNRADGVNYPEAVKELQGKHFHELGTDYLTLAELHRVNGKPHFIDKMPNNFPLIGFLSLILPKAKIIDARRHPMDACLSCYRQLFAKGQSFTYDLTEIGEYFLQYLKLMDHWHAALPNRILTVQYERVVTDFDTEVRRIIDFCGLPWEEACARFYETQRSVRTASSEQVRQPIYTDALSFSENYGGHLDELRDVLGPILERHENKTQSKDDQAR